MTHNLIKTENYLLVVDDKDKDFYAYDYGLYKNYKLGLVTGCNDDVLEFEGECIDESNLSKVIAHLPLNGSPILEGVPLLPPIDDDVLKMAKDYLLEQGYSGFAEHGLVKNWMAEFYNKAKEKFLLELEKQILDFTHDLKKTSSQHQRFEGALYGLNRLKYYLSQDLTEFECEMVGVIEHKDGLVTNQYEIPKTITTAKGVRWVGKYK